MEEAWDIDMKLLTEEFATNNLHEICVLEVIKIFYVIS